MGCYLDGRNVSSISCHNNQYHKNISDWTKTLTADMGAPRSSQHSERIEVQKINCDMQSVIFMVCF